MEMGARGELRGEPGLGLVEDGLAVKTRHHHPLQVPPPAHVSASGVIGDEAAEYVPVPEAFFAATLKVYAVPGVSPVAVHAKSTPRFVQPAWSVYVLPSVDFCTV